ncbi:zinc ion Hypothetical protein [Nesidiocoris tenuis]|uniref:RING-type domain-containing protein n=1 Tax=Nesidiocoris tenuis TaxID=355587 RepID=A0ABN7B8R7_9HEMI|nr:zinc ion Hypothetical protein [Nesidiocoris tenuis]
MNSLEFLHCNSCFAIPPAGSTPSGDYYLTNCGHTFCKNCINHSDPSAKCNKCGTNYKSIPLTSDLQGNLKLFFGPIGKIVKETLKIFLVQNGHCKIFIEEYVPKLESSYKEQSEKLNQMGREINALQSKYSSMCLENENLKKRLLSISSQMQSGRTKTPPQPSPAYMNFGGNPFDKRLTPSGLLTPSPSTISSMSRPNSAATFLRPSPSPIMGKGYHKSSNLDMKTTPARDWPNRGNFREPSKTPPMDRDYLKRVQHPKSIGLEGKTYRPQQFKLSSQPMMSAAGKSGRSSGSSMRSHSPCSSLQSLNSGEGEGWKYLKHRSICLRACAAPENKNHQITTHFSEPRPIITKIIVCTCVLSFHSGTFQHWISCCLA